LIVSRYLLDTTVLIDHLRGRSEVVEFVTGLANAGNELGVCSIGVAELYSGLSHRHQALAEDLIDSLEYWDATREDARVAGRYRYDFARKGVALATTDALVAAIAVGHGATLVTANAKHYPVEEMQLLEQP
jgi:predicted nucleic acid-binding protein